MKKKRKTTADEIAGIIGIVLFPLGIILIALFPDTNNPIGGIGVLLGLLGFVMLLQPLNDAL